MAEPEAATFGTTNLFTSGGFYREKLGSQGVPKIVMSQFKENLYQDSSTGPRQIINYIGDQEVAVTIKSETRLKHLRDDSSTSRPGLGDVAKRYRKQHAQNVKDREKQVLDATKMLAIWKSLTKEERVRRLKELRKPMRFMNDDPGFVAASDLDDVFEIPEIYNRNADISGLSADLLDFADISDVYTRNVDRGS